MFINNVGVVVGMIAGGTEVVCIVDDDGDMVKKGEVEREKCDARVDERASERIGSKLNQLPRVKEIRVLIKTRENFSRV